MEREIMGKITTNINVWPDVFRRVHHRKVHVLWRDGAEIDDAVILEWTAAGVVIEKGTHITFISYAALDSIDTISPNHLDREEKRVKNELITRYRLEELPSYTITDEYGEREERGLYNRIWQKIDAANVNYETWLDNRADELGIERTQEERIHDREVFERIVGM